MYTVYSMVLDTIYTFIVHFSALSTFTDAVICTFEYFKYIFQIILTYLY